MTSLPTTSTFARIAGTVLTTALAGVLVTGITALPAAASEIIASDQADSTIVASAATPKAAASIPRGIVVTDPQSQPVSLFAKGETTRRVPRPGTSPATFTHLTAGTTYTVAVGGKVIGKVTAVNRPAAAEQLIVRTTDVAGTVQLTWRHSPTRTTGGTAISYDLAATSAKGATVKATVAGRRTGELKGLDPSALYTFTVTPRNSAGAGKATRAIMSRSLADITGLVTSAPEPPRLPKPTTPAPTAPVTEQTPATTGSTSPAPAPAPATRTVYTCPAGFTDSGAACSRTLGYTYATQAYTTHQEQTGTTPTYMGTCDEVYTYWDGFSNNVGHRSYSCIQGGQPIYGQVKDATPAGWEDTGSQWRMKDAAPAGYSDNGHEYIQTADKIATVVPA